MLVGSHNGAVDHRVFIIRVGGQQGEDGNPYATLRPAAPSPVGIVPVVKTLGKFTPGDAGTVPMYRRIDEPAVINRGHTDRTRPSGQTVPDQVPLVITESVGSMRSTFVGADTHESKKPPRRKSPPDELTTGPSSLSDLGPGYRLGPALD